MSTTAFVNGSVFDGHRYVGRSRPVVVGDGRIISVGDAGSSEGRGVPRDADVVDLAGGLLAPGFVDAHVHAVQGGLERSRCDLSEGSSREEHLATIKTYAAAHPDLPWILGGGWAMAAFPGGTPCASDLDGVVPDRPVFLPNRDHHGAWVNTRAMELAGITRETPLSTARSLRARPGRQPHGHPARGSDVRRRPSRPGHHAGGLLQRAAHRAGASGRPA